MQQKMTEAGEDSSLEIVLKNVRNFWGLILVNLGELWLCDIENYKTPGMNILWIYEFYENVTGSFLAISSEAGSIKMGKKKSGLGPLCCLETEIIKFHNYNIIILLDCWDRQWYWGCPLSVTHGVFSMFGSDIWFWWNFCQQVDLCVLCIWKDSLASKAERCRLPITSKPRSVLSCHIKQEQPRNQTNRRNE